MGNQGEITTRYEAAEIVEQQATSENVSTRPSRSSLNYLRNGFNTWASRALLFSTLVMPACGDSGDTSHEPLDAQDGVELNDPDATGSSSQGLSLSPEGMNDVRTINVIPEQNILEVLGSTESEYLVVKAELVGRENDIIEEQTGINEVPGSYSIYLGFENSIVDASEVKIYAQGNLIRRIVPGY